MAYMTCKAYHYGIGIIFGHEYTVPGRFVSSAGLTHTKAIWSRKAEVLESDGEVKLAYDHGRLIGEFA